MSERNDGGPAFPQYTIEGEFDYHQSGGLSLRDYFAAKAMQAAMSRALPTKGAEMYELAVDCYRMADAMLKARQS